MSNATKKRRAANAAYAALAALLFFVAFDIGQELNGFNAKKLFLGVAVGAPPGPIDQKSLGLEVLG